MHGLQQRINRGGDQFLETYAQKHGHQQCQDRDAGNEQYQHQQLLIEYLQVGLDKDGTDLLCVDNNRFLENRVGTQQWLMSGGLLQ